MDHLAGGPAATKSRSKEIVKTYKGYYILDGQKVYGISCPTFAKKWFMAVPVDAYPPKPGINVTLWALTKQAVLEQIDNLLYEEALKRKTK